MNSRICKRKALKLRNGVTESGQLIDTSKKNGNNVNREILKEQINDRKDQIKWNENFTFGLRNSGIWNGNEREIEQRKRIDLGQQGHDEATDAILHGIKWNENATIGSGCYEMWNGIGRKVKQNGSINCSECNDHDEGSCETLRRINRNGDLRTDHKEPDESDLKVKRKKNIFRSLELYRNGGRIITNRGDEERDGSETKWYVNARKGQGCDAKSDEDGVGTKCSGSILRGQGDINGLVRYESEIKRNGHVADGNEGKVECSRNDLVNQNHIEKTDRNRSQGSGSKGQQNKNKIQQDGNRIQQNPDRIQQNPNGIQQKPNGIQQNPSGTQQNPNEMQQNPSGTRRSGSRIQRNRNRIRQIPNVIQQNPNEMQENPNGMQQNLGEIQQNPSEIQQNRNGIQRIGNAPKHQVPQNCFPRKTKTLGLLCRKFVLMINQFQLLYQIIYYLKITLS